MEFTPKTFHVVLETLEPNCVALIGNKNFALQSWALMHVIQAAPELPELSGRVPPELTSTVDSEKMTSQHSGSEVTCIDSLRVLCSSDRKNAIARSRKTPDPMSHLRSLEI